MNGAGGGPSRQNETSSALDRLSKATDELGALVSSLLDRIAGVCRPSVPSPLVGNKAPEMALSAALPMQVNQEAIKVAECVTRLRDALSRLEL